MEKKKKRNKNGMVSFAGKKQNNPLNSGITIIFSMMYIFDTNEMYLLMIIRMQTKMYQKYLMHRKAFLKEVLSYGKYAAWDLEKMGLRLYLDDSTGKARLQ